MALIELKIRLWTKVHGRDTWPGLYPGNQTVRQALVTPLSPIDGQPKTRTKPSSVVPFHLVSRNDKRSPILHSGLIFLNTLLKFSGSNSLELKTEFAKKSCQFKVTDGFRPLKVPTSSPEGLSQPYQHTYNPLIGSLFTGEFILDGIMEIPFLNVHFIVNFFIQIKTDLGSNYWDNLQEN